MIKGIQRRIIMVKDTESPYFDSAYFVIKSDISATHRESDILTEANRMLESYNKNMPPRNSGFFSMSKKGMLILISIVTLLSGFAGFMLNLIF